MMGAVEGDAAESPSCICQRPGFECHIVQGILMYAWYDTSHEKYLSKEQECEHERAEVMPEFTFLLSKPWYEDRIDIVSSCESYKGLRRPATEMVSSRWDDFQMCPLKPKEGQSRKIWTLSHKVPTQVGAFGAHTSAKTIPSWSLRDDMLQHIILNLNLQHISIDLLASIYKSIRTPLYKAS